METIQRDLRIAKQIKRKLSSLLDSIDSAIHKIEESDMNVEEGRDADPLLWIYEEVIECINRKIGDL